jgi:hypothetical protein
MAGFVRLSLQRKEMFRRDLKNWSILREGQFSEGLV